MGRLLTLEFVSVFLTFASAISLFHNSIENSWETLEQEINDTCGGENSTCAEMNIKNSDFANARCFCDQNCWKYGDCCLDAAKEAWQLGKRVDHRWKCNSLPIMNERMAYSIYMMGTCPSNWTIDDVAQKCRKDKSIKNYSYILDIPVVSSSTNITYVNIYCAICNGDTKLLNLSLDINCPPNQTDCKKFLSNDNYRKGNLAWYYKDRGRWSIIRGGVSFFNNKTHFLSSTQSRQCHVSNCLPDSSYYLYCSLFAYYVNDGFKHIKNPFCTKCDDFEINISCMPLPGAPTVQDQEISFSFLMDFNEVDGEYVGLKRRCPKGQVYDPVSEECIVYYCGKKFQKVGDECILNPEKSEDVATEFFISNPCPKKLISGFVWVNDSAIYVNKTNSIYIRGDIEVTNYTEILICIHEDRELKNQCREGQVYDSDNRECINFFCGKRFEKVGDKCISNPEITDLESKDLVITDTCPKRLITDFVWLNVSTVYVNKTNTTYSRGNIEFINLTAILVCIDEDEEYINKFSIIQSRLSLTITTISVVCLALHILVYTCIPTMRNLPGINLISLSSMLLIGQLLLLAIREVSYFGFCQAMAIVMHYAFLAAFFWMNVMSVDICRTFTTTYHSSKSECMKNYKQYCKYAWLFPAVIVGVAILIDNSYLLPEFRPRYGHRICWITRRKGLLLFFAIPSAILLIENIIFFILTVRGICRTTKATRIATGRKSENTRFVLYLKLALIMGLTWIFGFVASSTESTTMWYLFIVFNASQGIFIFLAFTLKPKILNQIKEKLLGNYCKKSNNKKNRGGNTSLQQATSLSNLNTTSTTMTNSK